MSYLLELVVFVVVRLVHHIENKKAVVFTLNFCRTTGGDAS